MKGYISSIILSLLIHSPSFCAENKLPAPSGKYPTSIKYLSFTDSSRRELFDNVNTRYRELTIKVWYPAVKKSETTFYLENPGRLVEEFGFSDTYRTLKTNSSREARASSDRKKYPVLIFSHGWGEHYSQNTILMEELASHGYIVFSLAHHFECKFSVYPDGRIVTIDNNSDRFRKIISEQMKPSSMEIFKKMYTVTEDFSREKIFQEANDRMPTLLTDSPRYWAEDIKFLINMLAEINISDEVFKSKLDLDRIGVFGMSMGGIAANEVCIIDKRVKAGVNIDGGIYGSVLNNDIITPFLFLNSQRYAGYGNLFTRKSSNETFSVTLLNSDHYNFSDYALYPLKNQSQLGTIDPSQPVELMNKLILLFFNKYLINKRVKDIRSACEGYQVEFVSKIS